MKTWIDVSGLYHWVGEFTGIQRVVYNMAKELSTSDMESGLFVFELGSFKEVSFEELEQRLKELNKKAKQNKNRWPLNLGPRQIIFYTVIASKKIVRGSVLDPPLRSIYNIIRKSYREIRGLSGHVHMGEIFAKGDIVILIDGGWQFADFADAIISRKKKVGFYLVHFVQDLIAYNNPALTNKGANKIIGSYFKKMFNEADSLIAISESTKKDTEYFLKINAINNTPQLFTITLGSNISPNGHGSPKASNNPSIPSNFILSVSTIEIRKNYLAFYYVYNLAFQKGIKLPHLVIVGRKGWMAEETYTLLTKDPKINKDITIIKANDRILKWLYKNCLFTVFPSFYEGWGLPVAESLAYGKCCISSNTSSMREVGKDLISYVSPYDTGSLLDEIVRLTNKDVREKMEQGIKERYKLVTWDDTFVELKGIIEQIEKQRSPVS